MQALASLHVRFKIHDGYDAVDEDPRKPSEKLTAEKLEMLDSAVIDPNGELTLAQKDQQVRQLLARRIDAFAGDPLSIGLRRSRRSRLDGIYGIPRLVPGISLGEGGVVRLKPKSCGIRQSRSSAESPLESSVYYLSFFLTPCSTYIIPFARFMVSPSDGSMKVGGSYHFVLRGGRVGTKPRSISSPE